MLSAAERFAARRRCVIVSPQAVKIEAVNKVSALRKLGMVARVAGQQAGRNRTFSAVMSGVRTTARSFGRVAHQLWLGVHGTVVLGLAGLRGVSGVRTTARSFGRAAHHLWLEVTGTVFLAMAAFGGIAGFREYMKYSTGHTTASRVAIAVCFTLTFAWFGLRSFWKVRRKSQRP